MVKILKRRVVGDPILREKARGLSQDEIQSIKINTLIENMLFTLKQKQYGIAMAAPQIGESIALAIVDLKPTPTRPDVEPFKAILINPKIVKYLGNIVFLRDGCVSIGAEDDPLYGWSERHSEVEVEWLDENGEDKKQKFDGFLAHVMQHEIDHLNGVLYIDRVQDPKTYITASEFMKKQNSQ